jgi:hypothetical protein
MQCAVFTVLHCTALHCAALQGNRVFPEGAHVVLARVLPGSGVFCNSWLQLHCVHCSSLCTALQHTVHCTALHCTALHCALHCTAAHCAVVTVSTQRAAACMSPACRMPAWAGHTVHRAQCMVCTVHSVPVCTVCTVYTALLKCLSPLVSTPAQGSAFLGGL